jgi:hypothetical protein
MTPEDGDNVEPKSVELNVEELGYITSVANTVEPLITDTLINEHLQ